MTLHQPWHDGVGRRVGKRLRHIRKPRVPPDPGGNRPAKLDQRRKKCLSKRGRGPTDSGGTLPGRLNLPGRRAAARIICGVRRTGCNSHHKCRRAMDRDYHYRPCGMSRHHTKIFVKEKLRNQFYKSAPPVQIICEKHLPTQFGPANIKHPICSNTSNYNHGTGTVAMVATLIIPTLIQRRAKRASASRAAKVQRRSKRIIKRIHGQREPLRKWLSILTFVTITICLIHRCIYVNTQQQHFNKVLPDGGHGIPVLLGTENMAFANPPEQHAARGSPFRRDQWGQNQHAVPGFGTELPIPKSSMREARPHRCD